MTIEELSVAIQAGVAVAALGVAIAAVVVASKAKDVAEQSVQTARRQLAMAAVPNVAIDDLMMWSLTFLRLQVRNTSAVPALALMAEAFAANAPLAPIATTRVASGRLPPVAPGDTTNADIPAASLRSRDTRDLARPIPSGRDPNEGAPQWLHRFVIIRLDYYGPNGAHITNSFDWDTTEHALPHLRRVEINPNDGGDRIVVELPAS